MKLKKIASLMLAGIMAVSMLAACGEGTNGEKPGEQENPGTSASTASTTLYDAMSKEARWNSTAASNADLDKALAESVEAYVSDSEIAELAMNTDYVVIGHNVTTGGASIVADKTAAAIGAKTGVQGTLTNNANLNDKEITAINVYRSYFGVSDQQVLENAADQIDDIIETLPDYSSDGKYEYDYTVSASVASKTYSVLSSSVTIKYVAVAVARSVTAV